MTRTALFAVTLFVLAPTYGQENVCDRQWHYACEYVVDPNRYEIGIRWDYSTSFDLSSRRLTTPPARGIYIRDGRKVVVK